MYETTKQLDINMKPTNEQEEFELIEDYLLGKLNQQNKALFEEDLKNDIELNKKVEKIQQTMNLLKESAIQDSILKTIRDLQKEDRATVPEPEIIPQHDIIIHKPFKKVIYWVGASAAASVMFILYLSLASIYLPDTEYDFNITRGIDSTKFTPEQRVAFSSFFDGQAHLAEGRYWLAVKDFQKSLEVKSIRPYFKEAAEWHLALAYVKSNQPRKAEEIYKKFASCTNCEYPVDTMNRWKLWWRIFWAKLV